MDLSAIYKVNTEALEQYNANKTKVAEGSDMFSVMLNCFSNSHIKSSFS